MAVMVATPVETEGFDPSEVSAYRKLAVAVIHQAVVDVATLMTKHSGRATETVAGRSIATDAEDFLLRRLWQDGCSWNEMYLADLLSPGMRGTLAAYCEGRLGKPRMEVVRLHRTHAEPIPEPASL